MRMNPLDVKAAAWEDLIRELHALSGELDGYVTDWIKDSTPRRLSLRIRAISSEMWLRGQPPERLFP
jgi:hypothetical protein